MRTWLPRVLTITTTGAGLVALTNLAAWAVGGTMAIDEAERWGRLVAGIGVPSLLAGYVLVKVNESVGQLAKAVNDLRATVIALTVFVKARG
jgi:hypothetical protein